MRLTSVDLPLPVLPTMAVVSPGRASNEMSRRTGCLGARVAELDVAELDLPAVPGPGESGCAGSRTEIGSVSSTSRIRPAETAARGTRTNMITAVMIANRICMRYCRNAVRLPIGIGRRAVDAHRRRTT